MRSFIFSVCIGLLLAGQAWAVEESEPNDDTGSANLFSIPGNASGTLQNDGGGVLDYFRFTLAAPGTYRFAGTVTGGSFGADLFLGVTNSSGGVLDAADVNADGGSETLEYTFTTAGTYYLLVAEATGTPNAISTYNVVVTSTGPDIAPPTWVGEVHGIDTVTRLQGNTTANVTWHQATDNVTAQAAIRYDIYYSTVLANIFTEGVKKTVTGGLSTTLSGLTATATYFVAVRARDEANNRDINTRSLQLAPLPNAAQSWEFYE